MGFKSFFKRGETPPAAKPVNDSGDGVQLLRVRARRRLIGAAVLVAIGVVGFPLVFETQPRPIPVDLPISIPRKDTAAPLVVPAAASAPPVVAADKPVEQAAPEPVAKPEGKPPVVAEARPVDKPPEKLVDKPADKPFEKPVEKTPAKPAVAKSDEGARALALLEGKAEDKASGKGRFIVQVGAFAEDSAAREARMKAERAGLKTYLQAVDTPAGKRIRVRVGPFADRSEAEKAAAKLKGTGLTTAVLTL